MPKSKYPTKLDTSVEIPVVRDNIIEIGSDVLNSLRSAIFQVERTLGINPQGAVGNTVADRLNKVTDGNGNILKEALDRANLLSGPIIDADVSKVAAIQESKLKLNYPTQVLQSEISILNSQIDEIIEKVAEIAAILSAHINEYALDRHPALSISISSNVSDDSPIATMSLEEGDVQGTFEILYDSHINYDGSDIAIDNRSHESNQIFFDKSNVSAYISSEDIQSVVEELTLLIPEQVIEHQDLFHSNGLLRSGEVLSAVDSDYGLQLISDAKVSFAQRSPLATKHSRVAFDEVQSVEQDVLVSDKIVISEGDEESEYEVSSVSYNADGDVDYLNVFGEFSDDSSSSATASVYKNKKDLIRKFSLITGIRERAALTSAQVLQIANPNSSAIISDHINPLEITLANRYFNIKINGGDTVAIDVFDSFVDRQTIDSVISRINEQAAEKYLMFLAYRVDIENRRSEIALVHNLPGDDENSRTLEVSENSGAVISALGLGEYEDKEIYASVGAQYYMEGVAYEGLNEILESSVVYYSGSRTIFRNSTSYDFVDLGVKVGYIATLLGGSDDGTYHITSVSSDRIVVDTGQIPAGFSFDSDEDITLYIHENIISLESVEFDEVDDSYGAMLLDVFMDSNKNIHMSKRLSYEAQLVAESAVYSVVDFDGDIAGKTFDLEFKNDADSLEVRIDYGPYVAIRGSNNYIYLTSGNYNITFKIYVYNVDDIITKILIDGDADTVVYGFEGVNKDTNLMLSRIIYANFKGRALGGVQQYPRSLSYLESGNIGADDISTGARNLLLERPIDELRSNGVVLGCAILGVTINSDDLYEVEIERGIVYVKGKRFEIDYQEIVTDLLSTYVDKFYIAVDEYGNIVFDLPDGYCTSGTHDGEFCLLGSVEYNTGTLFEIDLRLFIDNLDLKVLNSITVSPELGMGHFSDVGKAIQYAKRFSEVFPEAGVPTVHLKSGIHKVVIDIGVDYADLGTTDNMALLWEEYIKTGFYIDFPVNIVGEGDSSVLDICHQANDIDVASDSDLKDSSNQALMGTLTVFGPGTPKTWPGLDSSVPFDFLENGKVLLSNFKVYRGSITFQEPQMYEVDSGVYFDSRVEIDRVTFDLAGVDFDDNSVGFKASARPDYGVSAFGNISITNCTFKNSYILNSGSTPSWWYDLTYINNKVRNDIGGEGWWLTCGSGSVADESIPCANNIHIRSNVPTGLSEGGFIDRSQTISWRDVVSRDLYVCGNLIVGGAVSSDFVPWKIGEGASGSDIYIVNEDGDFGTSAGDPAPLTKRRLYTFGDRQLHNDGGDTDNSYIRLATGADQTWLYREQTDSFVFPAVDDIPEYWVEEINVTMGAPASQKYTNVQFPYVNLRDASFNGHAPAVLPIIIDWPVGEEIHKIKVWHDGIYQHGDYAHDLTLSFEVFAFTDGPCGHVGSFSNKTAFVERWSDSLSHSYDVTDTPILNPCRWDTHDISGIALKNTADNNNNHDKALLQITATWPSYADSGYGTLKIYKVEVSSHVENLVQALGLHTS